MGETVGSTKRAADSYWGGRTFEKDIMSSLKNGMRWMKRRRGEYEGEEGGIGSLISEPSPRVSGEKRPAKLLGFRRAASLSCGGGCDFDFMIFFLDSIRWIVFQKNANKHQRFRAKLGSVDDDVGPGSEHPCTSRPLNPSPALLRPVLTSDRFQNVRFMLVEIQAGAT